MACFDQPNEFVEVVYDVPSRLPALLDSGEVDAILVSSIEYLRREDLVIAADVGIMSNGPVASVRMLSKVPLDEIQTLALDESSMTSNMLAQIILAERGVRPSLVTMEPDQAAMLAACDACVLIGDKGLEADGTGLVDVDLGEAWTELTGLPFVWALWLSKRERFPKPKWDEIPKTQLLWMTLYYGYISSGFDAVHLSIDYPLRAKEIIETAPPDKLESKLEAIQKNLKSFEKRLIEVEPRVAYVVEDAAVKSGWSTSVARKYLSENVRYLCPRTRGSLDQFETLLAKHGFLNAARTRLVASPEDSLKNEILSLIPA